MKDPSCTPRTSSQRARLAGSGSWAMASRTILCASGVSVTTGVVVWRSSVVVAMGRSLRRAARTATAPARRSLRPERAVAWAVACARCIVPGRGHDPDRHARVDQLRGRRGRADVGVRRHVPDEQLDLHLRQRVPGGAHRPRARARPGLLQLRRPPGRQEGRPAGREGRRHPHAGRVAEPRDQEERDPREQERRDRDAARRRRLHLPQQARVRRRRRLRLPHRGR